jgi:acyl-coenzyme A thioesterase PaaI-like protein
MDETQREVALAPESGWSELESWPFPHGKPGKFVVGDESGTRFDVRYYRDDGDPERLHARIWFGPGTEGPPAHAHGGSMASVLDEVSGMTCWVAGVPVVAAWLNTRFLRMLPIDRVVEAEGVIHERKGSHLIVHAHLFDATGEYASSEGRFTLVRGAVLETIQRAMSRRGR